MSFSRTPILILIILCLSIVYMLFNIKNKVIDMRTELALINKQTHYEVDAIHILKGELAYLSSPDRLKRLNDQYLKLAETKVVQIINDPKEEMLCSKPYKVAHNHNIKWQYKKGPTKYITLVASK